MRNRNIYLTISLIFLIFLQSCDNGWEYDITGCLDLNAINYDPSADSDNGSCIFETVESMETLDRFIRGDYSSYNPSRVYRSSGELFDTFAKLFWEFPRLIL